MDEAKEAKKQAEALKEDMKVYAKLKKLNGSTEINELLDLFIKTASEKMVWAFTSNNIGSWEDFCKVRGEVTAYLYPIQEIRSAGAMEAHIKKQLDAFYQSPTE